VSSRHGQSEHLVVNVVLSWSSCHQLEHLGEIYWRVGLDLELARHEDNQRIVGHADLDVFREGRDVMGYLPERLSRNNITVRSCTVSWHVSEHSWSKQDGVHDEY